MENNIMKYETVLPANFNGVFNFTNWTDEDFIGKWGGKDYRFPANSTSPMVIPDHSPLEIQHIRKKFAKDLAEQQFFKSKKYEGMMNQEKTPDGAPRLNSIYQAATYNIDELTPFIQRCLEPLTITSAIVTEAPKERIEDKLTRNDDGELNTEAIDQKKSLKAKALGTA